MSNIVNLETFLAEKKFNGEVLSFFHRLNPYFHHYKDENEAVFVLNEQIYIFVFLKYVSQNEHTKLPNIYDCFYEFKLEPRLSIGEWVVEGIYEVPEEDAAGVFKDMENVKETDVYAFLKKVIKK